MSISIEAASQMVAHARAIGDATLERKLLRELHATAAHSEEAMPPVLSSDVDDSAIDALHEAVAATPRDPAAWLALARAHAGRTGACGRADCRPTGGRADGRPGDRQDNGANCGMV